MRLTFAEERILAVVAHPDDAELLCAGTLARARSDGAAIGICVLCRGDKGQTDPPRADLSQLRRAEMRAASNMLGAELFEGGFGDGELCDTVETRGVLIEIFRTFRPTLVLAHSANDYHPDHRAAGAIAEAASWFCASRGHETSSPPLETPPSLWWLDTLEMLDSQPTLYIDISEFMELKTQMLDCHRSQLVRGSDRDFSPLHDVMKRQAVARGAQSDVSAAESFRQHAAWKRCAAW